MNFTTFSVFRPAPHGGVQGLAPVQFPAFGASNAPPPPVVVAVTTPNVGPMWFTTWSAE